MATPSRSRTGTARWIAPLLLSLLSLWGCGGGSTGSEVSAVVTPAAGPPCLQSTAAGGVVVGSGLAGDPAIPEPQSGYKLGWTYYRNLGTLLLSRPILACLPRPSQRASIHTTPPHPTLPSDRYSCKDSARQTKLASCTYTLPQTPTAECCHCC